MGTLDNLYLNTKKLKELEEFERDHFLDMHKRLMKVYENYHNEMQKFSHDKIQDIPYYHLASHLYKNLIKHEILVSERELSIDDLLS